jgi:hypothetical protein
MVDRQLVRWSAQAVLLSRTSDVFLMLTWDRDRVAVEENRTKVL